MSNREAAPLTARLLARKGAAAPSGAAQPPQPTKATPRVQNVRPASTTLHAVDLTPPDFLRTENRDLPVTAQKNREGTS